MSRIILADPDPALRRALALLLKGRLPWVDWLEVESLADLESHMQEFCPHVLLLDWDLLDDEAEERFFQLRETCPDLAIIVMSLRIDVLSRALKLGADDFILKGASPDQVLLLLQHYIPEQQA